ncbi:CDP-diacylglycerol--glycerol-3-phosphate 3-phosphatidyltransferase [Methyloversatilis thermotolerans]|uniref:CDP-diacylglycerol--glycerol-3-phosphate 3-phosphatidyltransferase n=1 Tax=Methyloversatilis thermotolerans TaxID=1346290 RepID=UPI00037A68BA|nr:CDP-diacylglycerol--glycerol-3-phosphate 3-phosphatidyltransferase [Methyloversatilis thermotolerans]
MFTLPTALTWARILLIPLFVGVFFVPDHTLSLHEKNVFATTVFVVAAITDWLDGYLARTLNQTSSFGAFLDPVADKLMVAAALIMLVELSRTSTVIALIIIGREITISALREWMAKVGASRSVAVSMIGKIKTTAQMIAIPMLLYFDPLFGIDIGFIGGKLIWIAALLTVWSMAYYMRRAWPELRARKEV